MAQQGSSAPMIHVHQLRKEYADFKRGEQIALAGISFDATPGEVFGLLGPNGAGKTTALRILSTVLQPTSGTATVNGYDIVKEPSQVRHQIGFVSAGTGVYDRMTAWETVEYFGRLYGIDDETLQHRMQKIFGQLQMDEIRDVLGVKMSTGMKQKVSIARAMIHEPPVIILDEATAGLDVLVARSLIEIISRLREQGKCIVFSSHIMREVERLCDRVAIMHRGHILATGTIAELQQQYQAADMEDLFYDLISAAEEKIHPRTTSF